jgi:hypothetical protein
MINARAFLIALMALTGFVFAQQGLPAEQASSDPVKITAFPNGIFKFRQGKLNGSINLQGGLAGCTTGTYDGSNPKSKPEGGAASTRVIDQIRKDAFWYVTFQTVLGSGCNVQGLCGAGEAVTLVWLKMDANLKLMAKKAVILEECLTNTSLTEWSGRKPGDGSDGLVPKLNLLGGKLELRFESEDYNTNQKTISSLRYERRSLEKGLIVSSKTIPIR